MKTENMLIQELTAREVDAVSGGMNLEGYRESSNVFVQVREGPYIVEYDSYGRCSRVWWAYSGRIVSF